MILTIAQTTLTVFAAASLHFVFPALAQAYEKTHQDVAIRFSFNGSQILETQLEEGAPADVFASADERWMRRALQANVVRSQTAFASNELELVASPRSKIGSARDLTKPGTKLVLCAEAVPCGAYARRLLEGMDSMPAYGAGYAKAVLANVVSSELNVEAVLGKVELGEADAGIVYRTDAAGKTNIVAIELPELPKTPIAYYLGVVRASSALSAAESFAHFVLSPAGQKVLARYGFTAAPH